MTMKEETKKDEADWRKGVPTELLRKTTLIPADPPHHLPVHTLTFAMPDDEHPNFVGKAISHRKIRLDVGEVVKMVIPGYKPKSYSVSAKRADEFDVTFKVYPNGRASGFLDRLQVGQSIHSFGLSKKMHRNPAPHVGVVAYGVGITEALPVAQAELEQSDVKHVTLLWASRTMQDTFWEDIITAMQERYPDEFEMVYILSRQTEKGCLHGRVDAAVLKQVFQLEDKTPETMRFLSVGTKEMMAQTDELLRSVGFPMPECALLPKDKARTDKTK